MDTNFSHADWINLALLVVALFGILLTYFQVRGSSKLQRAVFLRELYSTITSDPGVCAAFYALEYDKIRYDGGFHATEDERNVDRLLAFLDLVAELHSRKLLTRDEMRFFEYRFRRVAENKHITAYMEFLAMFYHSNGVGSGPFPSYSEYANALLNKEKAKHLQQPSE